MTLALLVARSGLVDLGNEALPHVNDPPVHLVACVHALGREPEVRFIQLPHPGPVPGYGTCSVGILLQLSVVWVDDGRGEFDQGVLLRAAPDPVVVTDFDKVLAGQARNTERFYIVGGFHHGELVVGAVDKPVETVARLCGHAVVVDEDMMAHAQLGDGNLLIYAGTTGGVLEVDADHLVLVSSKKLLKDVDVVGLMVYTIERSISLVWVSTLCSPNSIGAPLDIPSLCVVVGVLVVLWGAIERLKRLRL